MAQIANGTHISKLDRPFCFGLMMFRIPHNFHGRLWKLEDTDVTHDTGLIGAREVAVTVKITVDQPIMAIPYTRYAAADRKHLMTTGLKDPYGKECTYHVVPFVAY